MCYLCSFLLTYNGPERRAERSALLLISIRGKASLFQQFSWTVAIERQSRNLRQNKDSQRTSVGWWMESLFQIIFNTYLLRVYSLSASRLCGSNWQVIPWEVQTGKSQVDLLLENWVFRKCNPSSTTSHRKKYVNNNSDVIVNSLFFFCWKNQKSTFQLLTSFIYFFIYILDALSLLKLICFSAMCTTK